jgi:hypothetical protein
METFSWSIVLVLSALLIFGLLTILLQKNSKVVSIMGIFICILAALGFVEQAVAYQNDKNVRAEVTALVYTARPDALVVRVDTQAREVSYMPKGSTWPYCTVNYSKGDTGYTLNTDSVRCQIFRPANLPPPSSSTTTVPPTTLPLFPPTISVPPSAAPTSTPA